MGGFHEILETWKLLAREVSIKFRNDKVRDWVRFRVEVKVEVTDRTFVYRLFVRIQL